MSPRYLLLTALALIAIPHDSRATITYYSTRSAFDAAQPGLSLEDFQPAFTGLQASPLSSTSNNSNFPPGNILPGITISDQQGNSPGLYVYDQAVGSNYFEDPLVLTFGPGIEDFAADFFGFDGSLLSGTFSAEVYNGTSLVASVPEFTGSSTGASFLGLASTTPFTSVVITFNASGEASGSPYVNNIAFGTAVPEPDASRFILAAAGFAALWGARSAKWHGLHYREPRVEQRLG